MILSEGRQAHIAYLVTDGLWKDDLVDYTDDDQAVRVARQGIAKFLKEAEQVDVAARKTISSLKRNVVEGSPEWDILYRKYVEEEMSRRGNA